MSRIQSRTTSIRRTSRRIGFLCLAPLWLVSGFGQQDYGQGPDWFPSIFRPYKAQSVPDIPLADPMDLSTLVREGALPLSLNKLREAVLKNNLDIAAASQNAAMAETDILRARGGGAPRGAPGVRIPSGLFAGAIGAGVGDAGGAGGSTGAGGITGSARQVTARPRGTFDPSIALNLSVDRIESPLNTLVVAGVPTVRTTTTALQARYAQAFTSGTSVSVSFNNQRQGSSQLFLRFNPAFVSSFSLVVTQQLLNGYGFDVNRRFLTVAKRGMDITKEAVRQEMSTTLSEAEALYWDLAAARENVRVAENALRVAEQLHQDNSEREEFGALSKIEVFTAASEVAARRRDLIAAQTVFELRETDLKNALTRDISKLLANVRVEPTDSLPDPRNDSLPRAEDMAEVALRNRPELRQGEANLANQDVAIRYTESLLKPTLVIFGMVNTAGLYGPRLDSATGQLLLPGGLGGAARQVIGFDYPEYAFGFSLQFPMINRSAQADNARARIEKQQAETSLQQLRNRIRVEVRNAMITLTQSSAQVESARKAVELRVKSLQEEQEKHDAGLSTPYDVIRRQRDLLSAQYEEVSAKVSYAKAKVELDRATGKIAD